MSTTPNAERAQLLECNIYFWRKQVSWGLLLAGGFKYIGSKVPRRDGMAAARAAAAPPQKEPRFVTVEYEEGGEMKEQE